MKISIEIPGFTGFYDGIWDQTENEWNARHTARELYGHDELLFFNDWGYHPDHRDMVAKIFAERYVDFVESYLPVELHLKGARIESPREYNFQTDRIFAEVEVDYEALTTTLISIAKEEPNYTQLADIIKRDYQSTAYHWVWMRNDIEDWFKLMVNPNNAHYTSYLIGHLLQVIHPSNLKSFNLDVYNYAAENTDVFNLYPLSDFAKEEYRWYLEYPNEWMQYISKNDFDPEGDVELEDYIAEFLRQVEERSNFESYPPIEGLIF